MKPREWVIVAETIHGDTAYGPRTGVRCFAAPLTRRLKTKVTVQLPDRSTVDFPLDGTGRYRLATVEEQERFHAWCNDLIRELRDLLDRAQESEPDPAGARRAARLLRMLASQAGKADWIYTGVNT